MAQLGTKTIQLPPLFNKHVAYSICDGFDNTLAASTFSLAKISGDTLTLTPSTFGTSDLIIIFKSRTSHKSIAKTLRIVVSNLCNDEQVAPVQGIFKFKVQKNKKINGLTWK
jgi:hypothetical protein